MTVFWTGLIRRQTSHCEEFGEADHKAFRGSTASVLDGERNAGKLAGCRQPLGANNPEKQKPAEGRALHPVKPGKLSIWQSRASPTIQPAVKRRFSADR